MWDPSGKCVREWKDVVHETHGIYIGHQGFIWATDIQGARARPREGRNQHWLGMFRLLSAVGPRAGGQLMTPRLTA